jgi:hypothetical protein
VRHGFGDDADAVRERSHGRVSQRLGGWLHGQVERKDPVTYMVQHGTPVGPGPTGPRSIYDIPV